MMRLLFLLLMLTGCGSSASKADLVFGGFGVVDGKFSRPRAAAIDPQGKLCIVDFSPRIQVFDLDGAHQGLTWRTPDFRNGRPSGMGIDRDGNLIVCDSHYHCIRIYDLAGKELRVIDGTKSNIDFGYVSDAVQDADGFYYLAEFGDRDSMVKLDPEGNVVKQWGKTGLDEGEFNRIRCLAFGPDGLLYAADSCNHRVQAFDRDGNHVRTIGSLGDKAGDLNYPYGIAFDSKGSLIVAEYGNNRVQKFDREGRSLGIWGRSGRKPGQLDRPWSVVVDAKDRIFVLDTENHRVQRFRF